MAGLRVFESGTNEENNGDMRREEGWIYLDRVQFGRGREGGGKAARNLLSVSITDDAEVKDEGRERDREASWLPEGCVV